MSSLFGYLSAVFITFSFLPYLVSIFRGQTRPERASWFLWSILGGISFFSQLEKGAGNSLWLPGIQTLGDLLIFILAIKYGMGGFARRDKLALGIAALSLVLWYITSEPIIALFLAIVIDGTGAALTIIKSYQHPATESVLAWVLIMLGGFFAIGAVGSINWILLAFPLYTFLANLLIIFSIKLGQRNNLQHT